MGERILIIDDERVILNLTCMILKDRGHVVFTADSAMEGLAIVAREQPALVVLDYMLPEVDGITTLRTIREQFPRTYVVMFTGKGSEKIAVELMKAGASDYILKPFSNQDLIDRIEAVLRLREAELHNIELRQEREKLIAKIANWNSELEQRIDEKSRELEKAHAEILQIEKLASLGHLSAGMAHEIRNPLNAIGLFTQLLQTELANDSEKSEYLENIMREVDRIDETLINLLALQRPTDNERTPVMINEIIEQVIADNQARIAARNINVSTRFLRLPPPLQAAKNEIAVIFSNLINNALHATNPGGTIVAELDHDDTRMFVSICDDGCGIPEKNLNRIFDPFFSTRQKGTGIGLSIVHRSVRDHGGRITVHSEVGSGTTFHLEFPFYLSDNDRQA
ncbi:MAG: response regulator [Desulfuromonadales bacterium]|nr:response regulator [Desulfuromonadales bacterium]MDT8423871.1 response regulator [Desulfuromonadales bacterium]